MATPCLLPVNESEAILEAFWNGGNNADGSGTDTLAPYHPKWSRGGSGQLSTSGRITLSTGRSSTGMLTLERTCDVHLENYDHVILSAALPSTMTVSLHGRLDGAWQTIIPETRGCDTCDEIEGSFCGSHLSGLRIQFTLSRPGAESALLSWLMVANRAGVARMESRPSAFDPDWPGLLESEAGTSRPQLGLFFDAKQLAALRTKMTTPHLKPHYQALLVRAEELLAITPETCVGLYAPGGDIARGRRKRDLGKPWLGAGVADLLAFAGILEEEPRFSRMAARMALALAHCGHWVHSFIGALPGTTAHPRCFSESYILRPLPLVLDWAGHCLTPAGRELIRDAMILKGLARVESDFQRWEYIRSMNQGLLFTPGRIHAYLALEKTYPRYRTHLLAAERDLKSMLTHYLQPDGGTLEGMGYWHSVGEVFPTLYALARRHGRSFGDAMGERIRRTADYALSMYSTADDGDTFLTINAAGQGHNKPSLMMASVFAAEGKSAPWALIYKRMVENARPDRDWFHLLVAPDLLKGRPTRPGSAKKAETPSVPKEGSRSPFYCFPVTGHAGVCREAGKIGRVRFHLFSGPSRGGHSHQDKGSFILEAAGEQLALDRGTTGYDNPAHLMMGKAAWHNLVVPEDTEGRALEQQPLTTFGGRLLTAEFSGETLNLVCDNRKAWTPGLFRHNRRRIWSPAPELYLIDDDLSLHRSHVVSFRLNSPSPLIKEAGGAWSVPGRRARLRIHPVNWQPCAESVTCEGVDWRGHPVWILRMATNKATKHRLLTLLEVLPAKKKEPDWHSLWLNPPEALELKRAGASSTLLYPLKGQPSCTG